MKKIFSFSITITIALLSVLFYSSCVTTKKKGADEPGGFKKRYHNLTSHYNYWFNADELFRLTLDNMNKSHKDNYNQLLPIYAFRAEDPLSVKPDMENVIKKSSTSIGLHRISGWTDDCYQLIGKSQYVKQDLETAEATFNFIKEEYNPNKKKRSLAFKKKSKKEKSSELKEKKKEKELTKKKNAKEKKKRLKEKAEAKEKAKKEREKNKKKGIKTAPKTDTTPALGTQNVEPKEEKKEEDKPKALKLNNPYKKSFFQRTSAYPASMVWFIRTYTAREKYNDAEYLIDELWNDPFLPKKLRGDLAAAEADNFIQQKRYKEAIAPLQKAVQYAKKKKTRARLSYILAQLYEKSDMHQEAYAAMNAVLKNRPTFEMEFNAKLQKVKSGWQNGSITAADAESSLKKMGKEDKNKEYKDQIYYTLGLIALQEKDKTAAIDYFKESLTYNAGNDAQKAETYLALANLYFETEQFVHAKNYFDSTLTALAVTDPRHKQVSNYAANLDKIARLITTIKMNDSIVALYNMTPDEKLAFAKKLKKQQDEAAEALALANAKDPNTTKPGGGVAPPIAGQKKTSFYFYNDNFVKKGRTDFNKVWGGRPLEDNWRRSQKSNTNIAGGTDPDKASGGDGNGDTQGLDDILKGIPSTPEEIAILHLSSYKSMYELGAEFRDKLENNKQCVKVLEESLARYPDSTGYQKESWYHLYVANKDLGNMPEAQRYYDLLVNKYPNSTYARTISDPNFLNASKAKAKELNDYYQETYSLFTAEKYGEAAAKCKDAGRRFGSSNVLKEKFALLNAICLGKTGGKDGYCTALKEVIGYYPDSPEAVRAKEICRVVGCPGYEDPTAGKPSASGATEAAEAFTVEDDKAHYFLVVMHGADIKINDVKISISDYNRLYHASENIRISNIYLGTDTNTPIFVLRKFDNKAKAMKYYNEVLNKPELLGENNKIKYTKDFYPITQENYRRILKNRSMEGYDAFFKANYQ